MMGERPLGVRGEGLVAWGCAGCARCAGGGAGGGDLQRGGGEEQVAGDLDHLLEHAIALEEPAQPVGAQLEQRHLQRVDRKLLLERGRRLTVHQPADDLL
eukprot:3324985-Prymnesium_polylepis.1